VLLATDLKNPSQKKYALKTFKKLTLMKNKQIKYIICELNILKQLSHPFIINLRFTFQTLQYVYLGLDYCPNHDLSHHLLNEVTFPEDDAMFYTAEVLLAIQYLHEKHNIIYRDLKPENIMLDEQGHVKLVDFGLSKQGEDEKFLAKSFCGSPAYLSPEMLKKKGVGK
jgi:serine/threonine protein kinase